MAYEPRGKVKILADAMRVEPSRIWTSAEVAERMGVQQAAVTPYLEAAIRNGAIFRKLEHGRCQYALKPFPAEPGAAAPVPANLHVPKFGEPWTAPKMTAPRPGSDVPVPSRAPCPPPATQDRFCLGCERPICREKGCVAGRAAVLIAAPSPAPTPAEDPPEPAPALANASIPEGAGAEVDEEDLPDAFVSCRTGEIVLIGLEPDEEGRITIPADLAQMIRRQTAWGPPR